MSSGNGDDYPNQQTDDYSPIVHGGGSHFRSLAQHHIAFIEEMKDENFENFRSLDMLK
jgi:hypothetical protein